jgi:hypothetical protein
LGWGHSCRKSCAVPSSWATPWPAGPTHQLKQELKMFKFGQSQLKWHVISLPAKVLVTTNASRMRVLILEKLSEGCVGTRRCWAFKWPLVK